MNTTIDSIIDDQNRFEMEVMLVSRMLNAYRNNPADFSLIISTDIKSEYGIIFDEFTLKVTNPEYFWESLNELASDIVSGDKKFVLKSNGVFSVLDFAKKKKKKTHPVDIFMWFDTMSDDAHWGI